MRPVHLARPVRALVALHILRRAALAIVLLTLAVLPGVAPAVAATGRGTVVIHARACSTEELAGPGSFFEACHDNPLVDLRFALDTRQPKATDANGNVSFKRALPGDHKVTLVEPILTSELASARAFCSNTIAGTGPTEATVYEVGGQGVFYTYLRPHDRLVCDVYVLFG